MSDQSNPGSAHPFIKKPRLPDAEGAKPVAKGKPRRTHVVILRSSAIVVAGTLSVLMVTAVAPPLVADQSDRAIVNAPVTLLTAPISGEVGEVAAVPGTDVNAGDRLARISNPRLDRTTLISLEEKYADVRERLASSRAKKQSDDAYVASLNAEIADQAEHLKGQFASQIEELNARVAQSKAMSDEKKALVDRQTDMVARNAASMYMLRPTSQQYSAALQNTAAESAKLNQKTAQLNALSKGIYAGDDLVAINTLAQKRRDIDLDSRRMDIEEKELSALADDLQRLAVAEQQRVASLASAEVRTADQGKVLALDVAAGRHVSAGDTVASVVNCDKAFVVAIFSYRQGQAMKVGTHVRMDDSPFRSGVVTEVLPKTSDKSDERFAIPFPQTERRELYAVIKPDNLGSNQAASAVAPTPGCAVGQWVTVTRDNGVVPSMSVAWRRLGNLLSSRSDDDRREVGEAEPTATAGQRTTGMARLKAAFRSPSLANRADEDWLPVTQSSVSR